MRHAVWLSMCVENRQRTRVGGTQENKASEPQMGDEIGEHLEVSVDGEVGPVPIGQARAPPVETHDRMARGQDAVERGVSRQRRLASQVRGPRRDGDERYAGAIDRVSDAGTSARAEETDLGQHRAIVVHESARRL